MSQSSKQEECQWLSQLVQVASNPLREPNGARVTIDGEWVILTGQVDYGWQKDLAEFVAQRAGPRLVRNEITVRKS
jgi:hypothetical protein